MGLGLVLNPGLFIYIGQTLFSLLIFRWWVCSTVKGSCGECTAQGSLTPGSCLLPRKEHLLLTVRKTGEEVSASWMQLEWTVYRKSNAILNTTFPRIRLIHRSSQEEEASCLLLEQRKFSLVICFPTRSVILPHALSHRTRAIQWPAAQDNFVAEIWMSLMGSWCFYILSLRLVVLFGEVLEPLGGKADLEEVIGSGRALKATVQPNSSSLPLFPVCWCHISSSLCFHYHSCELFPAAMMISSFSEAK